MKNYLQVNISVGCLIFILDLYSGTQGSDHSLTG